MQTFLPYANFRRSAAALDERRLGKQRVEVLQILRALHFEGYGWGRHPAVLMWRGWVPALVVYGLTVADAWTSVGRPDTTAAQIAAFCNGGPRTQDALRTRGLLPDWLGARALHRSHQSALVHKDPTHYRPLFPLVPDDLPYIWPPPGPEPSRTPISGWLVRGVPTAGGILLPAAGLGGPRRAALALERFRAIPVGALIVSPQKTVLDVGRTVGPVVETSTGPLRAMEWSGVVSPTALRFPAALQNPQPVSPLRGEDRLRA
jgi:hypothetical protein